MKSLTIILILLLPLLSFSQKEIQLLEKQQDGSNIISVKNTTKIDYEVTIQMEHMGVDLSRTLPYTFKLKAGDTKEVVTVTPKPETSWNYNTSISYTPIVEQQTRTSSNTKPEAKSTQPPSEELNSTEEKSAKPEAPDVPKSITEIVERKGLTLLVQPGCGRTMKVTEAFDLYGVRYDMVPLRSMEEFSEKVTQIGQATGIAPREAISPIVVEDGVPTYAVEDLDAFIEAMKKKYGNSDNINKNPGITLYTKPGCGRCTQAKDYLRSLDISYTEVNLTKKSSDVDAMWAGLRAQGFKGGSVQTPIVMREGKYYHEIPDVRKFLGELVKGR